MKTFFFVIAFFEIILFISLATFFVLPCVKYENIVFIACSSYIFLSSTIVVVQILLPKRQFSFFFSAMNTEYLKFIIIGVRDGDTYL